MLPTNESDTLNLIDAAKNQELQDVEIEAMIQLWNLRPFAREWDELDEEDHTKWKLIYDIDPIGRTSHPTGFVRFQDMESDEGVERKITTHVLSIPLITIKAMQFVKSLPTRGDMRISMAGENNLQ